MFSWAGIYNYPGDALLAFYSNQNHIICLISLPLYEAALIYLRRRAVSYVAHLASLGPSWLLV